MEKIRMSILDDIPEGFVLTKYEQEILDRYPSAYIEAVVMSNTKGEVKNVDEGDYMWVHIY